MLNLQPSVKEGVFVFIELLLLLKEPYQRRMRDGGYRPEVIR